MDGRFRIGRYEVSRFAFKMVNPTDQPPEGRMTLHRHDDDDDGPVEQAVLFFRGPVFGDRPTKKVVRAILPPAEFEPWYTILRMESPVFFEWEENDDDETVLSLTLTTGKEPPGEGVDKSS